MDAPTSRTNAQKAAAEQQHRLNRASEDGRRAGHLYRGHSCCTSTTVKAWLLLGSALNFCISVLLHRCPGSLAEASWADASVGDTRRPASQLRLLRSESDLNIIGSLRDWLLQTAGEIPRAQGRSDAGQQDFYVTPSLSRRVACKMECGTVACACIQTD